MQLKSSIERRDLGLLALVVVTLVAVAITLTWDREPTIDPPAQTPPTATSEKPPIPITVIGDSYTGGSHMSDYNRNWPFQVATELYNRGTQVELVVSGEGGSGYVTRGADNTIFPEEALKRTNPDSPVVIVFGGRNDMGTDVTAAARETYANIKKVAPNAKLIVIGPSWVNDAVPPDLVLIRDQVRREALAAGATFVDPVADRWFFGPDSALIGSDGVHPTAAGHVYLTDKIAPIVEEALGIEPQ